MNFAGKVAEGPLGFYRSRKKIKEKMKRLKEKMKRGLNILSRWALKGMSAFGRALQWFISKFAMAVKKALHFLKKAFIFISNALRGAFFLLRLMLAWIRVLFRYAMLSPNKF
jgi:hypothetical protein